MRIDLTALFSGKLLALLHPQVPNGRGFTELMQEKQQANELGSDVPMITQELPQALPLPPPAIESSPAIPSALTSAIRPLPASVPETASVQPAAEPRQYNPQWQLQQLVIQHAAAPESSTQVPPTSGVPPLAPAVHPELPPVAAEGMPLANTEGGVEPVQSVPSSLLASTPGLRPVPTPPLIATAVIHQPPQSPQWQQEVSQHIVTLSRNGVHNAEIRLHPESLGSLQISLRVQHEQAHIHIVSEHAVVRQAMEQALPQLRAALAESGMQLAQANISGDSANAHTGDRRGAPQPQQPPSETHDHHGNEDESVNTVLTPPPGNSSAINTFV
jgi:flagellar hook-length control protein FliK